MGGFSGIVFCRFTRSRVTYAALDLEPFSSRIVLFVVYINLFSLFFANSLEGLKRPLRPFLVPFSRDPNFVGREDIIKEIDAVFKSEDCVALAGIGGVG